MAWIPPGFAHNFCASSDSAEFPYRIGNFWWPDFENTLLWNDPVLGFLSLFDTADSLVRRW